MDNPLEQLPVMTVYAVEARTKRRVPVLVDGDYDGEWFSQLKLRISPTGYVYYNAKLPSGGLTMRYLHHLVLPPKKGFWVTFKDKNKLNCRSSNLTYMTPKQNIAGRKIHAGNRGNGKQGGTWMSQYRGVSRQGRVQDGKRFVTNRWVCSYAGNYIGSFDTELEAARMYDAVCRMVAGDLAKPKLNFPEEVITVDKPAREIQNDGIYPRCVWCGSEIYMPAVIEYSEGKCGCHVCGKTLPADYIRFKRRTK